MITVIIIALIILSFLIYCRGIEIPINIKNNKYSFKGIFSTWRFDNGYFISPDNRFRITRYETSNAQVCDAISSDEKLISHLTPRNKKLLDIEFLKERDLRCRAILNNYKNQE